MNNILTRKYGLSSLILMLSLCMIISPDNINAQGFPPVFDLSTLDGTYGSELNATRPGGAVSGLGDVNGDGLNDFLVTDRYATSNDNMHAGETYVVFGKTDGFSASLNLLDLNGADGFVLKGINADDQSGLSASRAGDVNGDGIDDILIGTYQAPSGTNKGQVYVIFGKTAAFDSSLNLSDLDGSNGFILNGIDEVHWLGISVSEAGDVNDDGVDDFMIGANAGDPNGITNAGETFVIFGHMNEYSSVFDLSTLNGSNGFVINGIAAGDNSGRSVSYAGDVNEDGISDLLIGAHAADPNGNAWAGETYVVFGQTSEFDATLELSDLDGSNGFLLTGIDAGDRSGRSVSAAGDVNGDGIDDFIIGAEEAGEDDKLNIGESYVVFGKSAAFDAVFDLADLNGTNGFVINGVSRGDASGSSVSGIGDVNNDGLDDLLIGAKYAYTSTSGEAYVVFGKTDAFSPSLDLSDLGGTNGFTIPGLDHNGNLGASVSGVGDVNADGTDDLIIGGNGIAYVLFGLAPPQAPVVANPLTDQIAMEDQAFTFTIPENTFSDINLGDTQALSAALEGGGSLPGWLNFDEESNIFDGIPTSSDVGAIAVEVSATDSEGLFVSDIFNIEVVAKPLGTEQIFVGRMYPNSAKDHVNLIGLANAHTATIYSISGGENFQVEVKNSTIDISFLKNGIYPIVIKSEDGGVIFQSRIVKSN